MESAIPVQKESRNSMITYSVSIHPKPETTPQEMDELFQQIQLLKGSIPGLMEVETPDLGADGIQPLYRYVFHFDTTEHMQVYNNHSAYLPVRQLRQAYCQAESWVSTIGPSKTFTMTFPPGTI
jgi:hypothetical protein